MLNLLNTEEDLVGEIKGENLEARGGGFNREDEEVEYLELGFATALLSFRLPNTAATALEFVREKIAVADILILSFLLVGRRVFSVWFMF